MLKRLFFLLFLSAMVIRPLQAEDYICELAVSSCYWKSDSVKIQNDMRSRGFTVLNAHTNQGNVGHAVVIGYKTTTDLSKAITKIVLVDGSTNGRDWFYLKDGEKEYWLQPVTHFGDSNGDLNQGAAGPHLYLYYSNHNSGHLEAGLYNGLTVSTVANNAVSLYEASDRNLGVRYEPCNLNSGNAGKTLYLNLFQHNHNMEYKPQAEGHDYRCKKCGLFVHEKDECLNSLEYRNENNHWGRCFKCNKAMKSEAHSFTRSSTTEDIHSRVCVVCHFLISDTHKYGAFYNVDESHHMYVCSESLCGYNHLLPHHWTDRTVVIEPTFVQKGIAQYTCSDCKSTKRELIEVLSMNSPENYGYTMTDNDEREQGEETCIEGAPIESSPNLYRVFSIDGKFICQGEDLVQIVDQLPKGQLFVINGRKMMIPQ